MQQSVCLMAHETAQAPVDPSVYTNGRPTLQKDRNGPITPPICSISPLECVPVDILPTAEAGGFAPSRARFPVSTRLAHTSFRPSRSDSLSTGIEYRQSGGMYVLSGIDITVMDYPTFGTCPDTHIKRKGSKHMTIIEAALRGGVELVNPDKGSAIPLGFVFQLAHELTPSHIANRFGKTVVLYHVLDLQTLHAYDLVLTYDVSREFVLVVPSPISNLSMYLSNLVTGFGSILRAFLLPGLSALCLSKFLLIFGKELGIAVGIPITGNNHALESQVKPNLLVHHRERLDIFFQQERDKIAVRTICGDGDRRGFSPLGQGATQYTSERFTHLGEGERSSIPLKGRAGIGGRLLSMFLVELRILCTPLKEMTKSCIQMTQGLLQGNRRNVIEPYMVSLFLEGGQALCCSLIVQALTILVGGIGSLSQGPVIDIAATPEGTGKDVYLLSSWVYSVLVGFLLLHSLHYSRCAVSCQTVTPLPKPQTRNAPYIPVAEALILTHILQMDFVKWPIKPSRMAGCITISTISFRSTSEPKKMWVRNRAEARGFTARFDKKLPFFITEYKRRSPARENSFEELTVSSFHSISASNR